jgi:hypothetical protein
MGRHLLISQASWILPIQHSPFLLQSTKPCLPEKDDAFHQPDRGPNGSLHRTRCSSPVGPSAHQARFPHAGPKLRYQSIRGQDVYLRSAKAPGQAACHPCPPRMCMEREQVFRHHKIRPARRSARICCHIRRDPHGRRMLGRILEAVVDA